MKFNDLFFTWTAGLWTHIAYKGTKFQLHDALNSTMKSQVTTDLLAILAAASHFPFSSG